MKGVDPRQTIDGAESAVFRQVCRRMAEYAESEYSKITRGAISFSRKHDRTRVTELDLRIERAWRDIIKERFPSHSIIGEELGEVGDKAEFCWYLDPVDGTYDLTRGIPLYGFIIALEYKGLPVAAVIGHPALGLRATAHYRQGTTLHDARILTLPKDAAEDAAIAIPAMEDFLRESDESALFFALSRCYPNLRIFRNAYAHTLALMDGLDAVVEYNVAKWDVAATRLLIEEAGGKFVVLWRHENGVSQSRVSVVFGKSTIVAELSKLMNRWRSTKEDEALTHKHNS